MTITEFLLERIAEDEAVAQTCPPWPWRVATIEDEVAAHDEQTYAGETVAAADGICVARPYALSGAQTRAVRDHIARHDPARVLAECEAKRQIVALHQLVDGYTYRETECCARCTANGEYPADDAYTDEQNWPCPTLRALAAVYADHHDYRGAWSVGS